MAEQTNTTTQAAPAAQTASPSTSQPSVNGAQTQGTQPATTTAPQTGDQSYRFGGKEYKSVEDLGKAYEAANSELGKWTQKHGDLEKQYQQTNQHLGQWNQWWKTVEPLWGQDVEGLLQQKLQKAQQQGLTGQAAMNQAMQQTQQQIAQQGQNGQNGQNGQTSQTGQNGQQPQDQFQGWEYLTPQQQYGKFRDLMGQELGQRLQQERQLMQQQTGQYLQQKEQWYQQYLSNHLSLLRRALENKLKDPNYNIDAVMEHAAKAISGQIDPMELGQQLLSAAEFQNRLEQAKKEAYEAGKADQVQQAANKSMGTVPTGTTPVFKMPVNTNPKKGFLGLRESAAQALINKVGPQAFSGE